MASIVTPSEQLAKNREEGGLPGRPVGSLWPRAGVRTRQIALITLLVSVVVMAAALANVTYLAGVLINRTNEQAKQLSNQIQYALLQDLANFPVDRNPYIELASTNSGVRKLMESTLVTSRIITYVYLTNEVGHIIADGQGRNELAINTHMIGNIRTDRPDIRELADANGLTKLVRVFFGEPIYEFHTPLTEDGSFPGKLHIGVSAAAVRNELGGPLRTNLIIGLLAVMGAAIVALSSANLLLRPLEAISTSIDRMSLEGEAHAINEAELPQDEMVTGVTTRLKQLGQRLAGERSELEIMRGRLRQVISHLEERLLLINREGRVILASPDAEEILCVEDAELTGLPVDESLGLNHPLVILIERAFSERRSIARTILRVLDGKRPRQLLASVQYIEDAGEPVGALVSLRDYESFQKYESQWDLSKKLADLGRITSGIAHEVKNPLNAMVIHLEILRSKLESGKADPTPQIEILDSEIKRLDRVVQTFLNFTRPLEVRLEPLDLNVIVNQVVALASTEANERGVTIKKEIAPDPLIVKGDSDLLTQALLNVIMNGCQAMPEGGPLKVSTSRGPDGSHRINITDRGVGIAPDDRERIFNLYYTTKKGGTGIGLAQAFRAIQLHNGQIRFDSEVGVGTSFEIILPVSN